MLMILNSHVGPLGRGAILSHVYGLLEHMEERYQPHLHCQQYSRGLDPFTSSSFALEFYAQPLSSVSRRKSDPTLKDITFRKDG